MGLISETIQELSKHKSSSQACVACEYLRKWEKVVDVCQDSEEAIEKLLEEFGTPKEIRKQKAKEWVGRPKEIEDLAVNTVLFLFPEIKSIIKHQKEA